MELKTSSSFKTVGLLQPWKMLSKIFSKCLTTRVTGWDQPPLQIMQMMYCFINNIHVDYAELLWEGLYYSLHHPTSSIPYPRFTKIIIRNSKIAKRKCGTGQQALGAKPKSDKESPKVEITNDEEVEITNVVIPVNVNEEEEEITDEGRYTYLFEHLKAQFLSRKSFATLVDHLQEVMVKSLPTMVDTHIKEQVKKQVPEQVRDQVPVYVAEGLILERQKTKEEMERMIAKAILQERGNIQAKISSQIHNAIDNHIPSQVDASVRSYMSGHILHVHPVQSQTTSVPEQQYQLYLSMKADPQLQQQDIAIWLALQMKFERLQNSAQAAADIEYEAYVSRESSSGQVNEEERDDDEIPTKQVSQDIMQAVSLTIDEAKLKKMADEMLRQRCTSGDEHQYHIDQMKNFLKSDIVWESRKEILVSPHPQKTTPLV
ncbi:hypothetical protein Tco_0486977 [Tanacetum coccineum]